MMMMVVSRSLCRALRLCSSALVCQLLSPTCLFPNRANGPLPSAQVVLTKSDFFSSTSSFRLCILYLFTCSLWFPVQRQVWLQYRATHSQQAPGHCGERSRHGLPPRSWSRADGQLHRTRLHNWGHGNLSGKVSQKNCWYWIFYNNKLLFAQWASM